MTKHDAIKHLSYKIAYAKRSDEKWVDCIHIEALEIAVRAMAEERKKGTWLIVENPNYSPFDCSSGKISVCSVCGYAREQYDFNYCPNCGADMREETDDAEMHRR